MIRYWSPARFVLAGVISYILICGVGCASMQAPILEYTLADTAIKAAKAVQAVRYSPGNWHEAEEAYRQARILYNEREYEQAVELFEKARRAAEKAENSARLIRLRNGEVL